jgi:hypothetical protein
MVPGVAAMSRGSSEGKSTGRKAIDWTAALESTDIIRKIGG